jgi:trans-2,3-dihydro-3-hydroxyanthranilate isomerase
MVSIAFATLDVFTDRRFAGNPLAVVVGGESLDAGQMQRVAREFNLSETIFVLPPERAGHDHRVRIFTPGRELPFAGHPIVGCAVFLAERRHKDGCPFETRLTLQANAGPIPVTVTRIGDAARARFVTPVLPAVEDSGVTPAEAAAALGLAGDKIAGPARVMTAGNRFLAIPVRSPEALARAVVAEPAFGAATERAGCLGVYPYTELGGGDWRARLFAPASGVPEDPATGSAAAAFPAVLLAEGRLAGGVTAFDIHQGVEMGRPSLIRVEAEVSGGAVTAVSIAGGAIKVSEGVMML